ncbi:O-methyltransferase [Zobellella maritima]|uniref:O-methyltransferase n=1 Tax=Zobellella maritima TaxID=2059725 RepID=UPI000E307620|nr:O-methyltransferase [Zobellella maritima]
MHSQLEQLKRELEQFGRQHDAANQDRAKRMLNIPRDTCEFLSVLIQATAARHILEIGTSNGYSTLWLAEAAHITGGKVITVEYAEPKCAMARENFAAAGLDGVIESHCIEAGRLLSRLAPASQDLIFLDSERSKYLGWWPSLQSVLRPGGLLVVDNALSHQQELAEFTRRVASDPGFTSCLVPVGKGKFLATKARLRE